MVSSIDSSTSSSSDLAELMRTMRSQRKQKTEQERSDELFKTTDANNDGTITKDELTAALKKKSKGNGQDGPNADELFSQLDADGDGKITSDEHSAGLKAMHQKLEQQAGMTRMGMPPPPPDGEMSSDDLFASTDADGDGSITKDELTAALKARQSSTGSAKGPSVDDLFKVLDGNGDGSITKEEHAAGMKTLEAQRTAQQSTSNDSSGISASVLKALLAKYGATNSLGSVSSISLAA